MAGWGGDGDGDGDGRWPKAAVQVSLEVTDAPESPRFDVQHYQFTVSEFARKGKYEVWRVRALEDILRKPHKYCNEVICFFVALKLVIQASRHVITFPLRHYFD